MRRIMVLVTVVALRMVMLALPGAALAFHGAPHGGGGTVGGGGGAGGDSACSFPYSGWR